MFGHRFWLFDISFLHCSFTPDRALCESLRIATRLTVSIWWHKLWKVSEIWNISSSFSLFSHYYHLCVFSYTQATALWETQGINNWSHFIWLHPWLPSRGADSFFRLWSIFMLDIISYKMSTHTDLTHEIPIWEYLPLMLLFVMQNRIQNGLPNAWLHLDFFLFLSLWIAGHQTSQMTTSVQV